MAYLEINFYSILYGKFLYYRSSSVVIECEKKYLGYRWLIIHEVFSKLLGLFLMKKQLNSMCRIGRQGAVSDHVSLFLNATCFREDPVLVKNNRQLSFSDTLTDGRRMKLKTFWEDMQTSVYIFLPLLRIKRHIKTKNLCFYFWNKCYWINLIVSDILLIVASSNQINKF